jgi:SAM-dependent methyltransferase
MDEELKDRLRQAYNLKAEARDGRTIPNWRIEQRNNFAALLLQENKKTVLELGAGTGVDGLYFQRQGLDVFCTDLSPEMVRFCRAKGLKAEVMDFTRFDFLPESFEAGHFDAAFALNCLLHLPKKDLPAVLGNIQSVLKPDGLFYMGVYGGYDFEDIWEEDDYEPKRFFSFYTDDELKQILAGFFDLQSFQVVRHVEKDSDLHFQSVIMRKIVRR